MLLDAILIAATLSACPGEVYIDQPREGFQPIQESNKNLLS